ncbi:MAG: hypothetical protein IKF36_01910 [Bacilli bacterium]|nr:hypothetical protein [Bacilli bacterium]
MKKMKEIYKKFIAYASKKENFGKVLLGILLLIFLVLTIIYFIGTGRISKIEEEKITRESAKYLSYIEDITESDSDEIDKYIIFALDYSLYNENNSSMTSEEISKFIKTNLNIDVDKEKIINLGITEEMLAKNITYDAGKDIYTINQKEVTGKQISETKIIYYKLNNIKKTTKSSYKAFYDKYVITNPYDMLNYYIDKNAEEDNKEKIVDITAIRNYLLGSSSVSNVKEIIKNNEDDLSKYAETDGSVTISYSLVGDELVIDGIN